MSTRRHGGITGKARRVHRLTRVSHRVASEAIDEYFMPDHRAAGSNSMVPVRRGQRFLASFNGRRGEPLPSQQLELPYPGDGGSDGSRRPTASPEPLDTGWTLIRPDEAHRRSTDEEPAAARDRREGGVAAALADGRPGHARAGTEARPTARPGSPEVGASSESAPNAPKEPKPTPVIRAPRHPKTAAPEPTEDAFSIRRFLMGCAAGLATAAMILITIRLAAG